MNANKASFVYATKIGLRHTDAAGIVFFARYFELMQDALEAFLESRGLGTAHILRETDYFLPVVKSDCSFSAPLFWGDELRIEVRVPEIRRRSFTIGYRFVTPSGKTAAEGVTVHVTADQKAHKSMAIPAELMRALKGK